MITGRIALGGLNIEFGNAESRFRKLAEDVEDVGARHAALLDEERELIDRLGRLYLPDLSESSVLTALESLRSDVRAARERQSEARTKVDARFRRAVAEVEARAREQAAREADESDAADEVALAERRLDDALADHPEHSEVVASQSALSARRLVLQHRRTRLAALAGAERRRYEADPAFRYLRNRAFGEPSYRGGLLSRALDRWLARSIDFETLDRKERILRQGPQEIQREIRGIDERLSELRTRRETIEADTAGNCGMQAVLERAAVAQSTAEAARERTASAEAARDRLAEELREIDADRGGLYEEQIEAHRAFLQGKDVEELLRLAASTPDSRDDVLVARLHRVRDDLDQAARQLHHLRRELDRESRQVGDLATLKRTAGARFLSPRSFFPDDFKVEDLLDSLLTEGGTPQRALATLEAEHAPQPFVGMARHGGLPGWIAEIASSLGAVPAGTTHRRVESQVIVTDGDGRVVHRSTTVDDGSGTGGGSGDEEPDRR